MRPAKVIVLYVEVLFTSPTLIIKCNDVLLGRHPVIGEDTERDIITFYNERGASEKNFDIQNNDFGWSHLPFSFMAENMVFMMVTAILIFQRTTLYDKSV